MVYFYLEDWEDYTIGVIASLYLYLDGCANYTLEVVVWHMHTSTAGKIIPSG